MSATHAAQPHAPHSHVGRYVKVWLALMVLTAITWGLSRFHIPGGAGVAVALVIASVKGGLVALFFMHLYDQQGPNRLVLLTSIIFVALLIGLTILDNATRFPLANPPDSENTPRQLRDAILGTQPPAAPRPPAAH